MFAALGKFVVRARWWVIAAWIVTAVVIAVTAPALQSTQDQSEFLPGHYESVKALTVQQEAFPERGEIGAIVVFDREDGSELTQDDQAEVSSIAEQLNTKSYENLGTVVATPASENGLVQAIFVQVKPGKNAFDPAAIDDARNLRADLKPLVEGTDLRSGVTGPAAQSLDSQESSEQALAVVSIVTLLLIVVLLALIFRSVIACALPIVTVALVGTTANGLIAVANEAFDLKADSSISVILFIVLFGIGTDYILFFLFRYREALRLGFDGRRAVSHSVERAGEAIAFAGGAVIIVFMAMVLSSLSIFRSIGPALAIAVAMAVLAALTLVPAVVVVLGPRVTSWPSRKWMVEPEATRFRGIGRSVAARPVRYAVVSAGSLAVLSLFALGFNPTFNFSDSSTEKTESGQALITFQKGQPSGAADPRRCCCARQTARGSTTPSSTRTPPSSAQRVGSRRRRWPPAPTTSRRSPSSCPTTPRPTRRWPTSRVPCVTPRTRPRRTGPSPSSAAPRRSSSTSTTRWRVTTRSCSRSRQC